MLSMPQEKGQGLVEYVIILSFVALVVIVAVRLLGPTLRDAYNNINNSVP
jgi:Flp pilus assembly pilin Flp